MNIEDRTLTLRQRYEVKRQTAHPDTKPNARPNMRHEDELLRSLVGRSVVVRFQNGGAVTETLATMDRFTMQLGTGMIVFKHAVQSVRPAENSTIR